jgi:hypothetical protein
LNGYHDNYFREAGACIYSFAVVNPASLQVGAAGKQLAIERAFVFPLYGVVDPRAPGDVVPASIKWLNDELDNIGSLADRYPSDALKGDLLEAHRHVVAGLRTLRSSQANHAIAIATSVAGEKGRNAEHWETEETRALSHIVNTLDIFSVITPVTHSDDNIGHAVGRVGGADVDIVAVLGETHEKCLSYADKKIVPGVLRAVFVISKDEDGRLWDPREGSFLRKNLVKGGEMRFTDPKARMKG